MFYSETILSRRGPLGKVWLAAHMERKLSKTQTLQTDIEQSVDAIMGQEIEVMALRLSGQLLLGVVRIYSRKAKYLLDDCNEALLKIKMAFRPGLVDMTDDQLVVSKNSITLPSNMVDLDLLLPDVNWNLDFERHPQPFTGHHQARVDDITLHTMDSFQQLDVDPFDVGPHDGIGSQDLDLEINWDDRRYHENRDDISSLGIGRDASPRTSIHSYIEGNTKRPVSLLSDRSPGHSSTDFQNRDALDLELPTFESVDLGKFGVGFDHHDLQSRQDKMPSGASSPLTELPPTPPNDVFDIGQVSAVGGKSTAQKKFREKRQIVDSVTELQDDDDNRRTQFDNGPDSASVIGEQQFLRKSPIVLRLLEIHNNPIVHFFHGKGKQGSYCGASSSLGPELMQLFMRSTGKSQMTKRSLSPSGRLFPKRPRIENLGNTPEVELEYGRKDGSPSISLRLGSDVLQRFDGVPAGVEDQSVHFDDQMDVHLDSFGLELSAQSYPSLSKPPLVTEDGLPSQELERMDNAEEVENLVKDACPIADFDLGPLRHSQDAESNMDNRGFSKNTLKALEIIRKGFSSPGSGGMASVLNFQTLSTKATRRAAASFFFELLVLGTRDCLHLSQSTPFENIEITAKEKLWTQLGLDQLV